MNQYIKFWSHQGTVCPRKGTFVNECGQRGLLAFSEQESLAFSGQEHT